MAKSQQTDTTTTADPKPAAQLPEDRAPSAAVHGGAGATRQQRAAPADSATIEPHEPTVIVEDEGKRAAVAGSHVRAVDRTQSIEQPAAARTVNNGGGDGHDNGGHGGGGGGNNHPPARRAAPQPYDDFAPARRSRTPIWVGIGAAILLAIFLPLLLNSNDASKAALKDLSDKVDTKASIEGVKEVLKDYYTKADIDAKLQGVVTTKYLTDNKFVKASELDEKLQGYARTDDLAPYAKTTDVDQKLKGKVGWGSLNTREKKFAEDIDAKLKGYATHTDIDAKLKGYATKSELDDLGSVTIEVQNDDGSPRDSLTVP